MAALLQRKRKTFERVSKPAAVKRDFKAQLDRAAEKKIGKLKIDTVSEEPPAPAKVPKQPAAGEKPAQAAEAEETYTSRLLAAKKRARKSEGGEQTDEDHG